VGVINCRETETGEIAISIVLPEPMSAVRHVSSRGHEAGPSFEDTLGRSQPRAISRSGILCYTFRPMSEKIYLL